MDIDNVVVQFIQKTRDSFNIVVCSKLCLQLQGETTQKALSSTQFIRREVQKEDQKILRNSKSFFKTFKANQYASWLQTRSTLR